MIGISTQVQSTYHLLLQHRATSRIREYTRRVSRTATLDGSSVITDSGYTDTDRTLEIRAEISENERDDLAYMFKTYSLLNVSTPDGFFSCAPRRLVPGNGEMVLTLLVQA